MHVMLYLHAIRPWYVASLVCPLVKFSQSQQWIVLQLTGRTDLYDSAICPASDSLIEA